jgi:endonuclease III
MVFMILAAQTEFYGYRETYHRLQDSFRTWRQVLMARESDIARAIKYGGLARKKARQIKEALRKIVTDFGSLSLNSLRKLGDGEVEDYLNSLAGIGAKSARCIMLYSLDRQVFPVDTHTWRISRRLGLTPTVAKPTERMGRKLEEIIPPDVRFTLHVNMVSHGRKVCTPFRPKCSICPLSDICPSSGQADQIWYKWSRPGGFWANEFATADQRK